MRELRVAALSEAGDHLVLMVAAGGVERFRLPVDERLRAALSGRLGRVGQQEIRLESALSPRQIQARLRAGEAAEQVARVAGVPLERVTRYEGPVLAERARVAEEVRAATLSVTGGEWTGVPLGGIVTTFLEQSGRDPRVADWDAWRRDDGRWVVEVRFGEGPRAGSARWLWDPGLARLTGLDEGAAKVLAPVRAERPDEGRGGLPAGRSLRAVPSAPDETEPPARGRTEPVSAAAGAEPPAAGPAGVAAGPAGPAGAVAGPAGGAPVAGSSDSRASATPSLPARGGGAAAAGARTDSPAGSDPAGGRRNRRSGVPAWADVLLGPNGG